MSIRTERVASLIKQEIAGILIKDFNEPGLGFTTVTEVSVSGDLRIAKVYFSVFGDEKLKERTMATLEAEKGRMRGIIGSRMRLRFVPELQFFLDGTMDRVDRINQLINKIHKDQGEPDRDSET
jgi:ribosome-binding factor A